MQKVRGHLHSDSTPSWPTDHVARKGREMRHRCALGIHLSHRQTYTPQPEDQGSEEVPRQYARKPPSSPGAEQSSPSLRPPRSSSTPSPPAVASSRLHVLSRDRHRVVAATTPCRPLPWPLSAAGRLRPVLHRDPLLLRLWIPLPVPGHLLSAPHSLRD